MRASAADRRAGRLFATQILMLIVMMLALALVTGADDRPWDRARVVDALQKLMKTGEPRHVDHDEGQELWGSLSLLLQSGPDPELEGLAHRAACPIVVRVYRPLDTIDRAGLEVTTRCVLPLRSPVGYRAIVEANPDGGGWRKLAEVRHAFGITIDVTAGSGELALLRRRFVRDVPAGGRVEIPISVPLQAPYGWVFVATPFGDHSETLRQDFDQPFKLILINRDAAPEDFVRKVCESAAGRPSC